MAPRPERTTSATAPHDTVVIVAWSSGDEWLVGAVGDAASPELFRSALDQRAALLASDPDPDPGFDVAADLANYRRGLRALRIVGPGAADLAVALLGVPLKGRQPTAASVGDRVEVAAELGLRLAYASEDQLGQLVALADRLGVPR